MWNNQHKVESSENVDQNGEFSMYLFLLHYKYKNLVYLHNLLCKQTQGNIFMNIRTAWETT